MPCPHPARVRVSGLDLARFAWKFSRPPSPHQSAVGGQALAGAPHPISLTKKDMLRIPHPDFPSWQRKTLDKFAKEAFVRMNELEEANEQLKQDLRDAMKLLRKELKNEP